MDEGTAYYITLPELKEATNNFSKQIGKGSFGSVYYGKMRDGKEVAVKTMTDPSSHGNQQFVNEVAFPYLNPPFRIGAVTISLSVSYYKFLPAVQSEDLYSLNFIRIRINSPNSH